MKPIFIILLLCSFFFSGSLAAASLSESLDAYISYLGMTIEQVYNECGAPHHLSTYRGEGDREGSAVFSWENSFSLFWADDRVWQLRMDESFQSDDTQVLIGLSLNQILQDWGTPQFREETLLIYTISGLNYPVGCALYFGEKGSPVEDRLIDIYIYRSDY